MWKKIFYTVVNLQVHNMPQYPTTPFNQPIDDLHISHNASGMGPIRVILIRNSSSHSSLDVNGLELPCLAAKLGFTRLRNQR